MEFNISENNRKWIEKNLLFFTKVCGFPRNAGEQFLLNEIYFPKTAKSTKKVDLDSLFIDLSNLLQVDINKISLEIIEDLRDTYGIPLVTQGNTFETDMQIDSGKFVIYIANSLQNRPNRLLYNVILEFIKIKLSEYEISYEQRKDIEFFIFLAGIYFGFGVILTQKRIDVGRSSDGFWQTTWKYRSEVPDSIIIYAHAIYQKIFSNNQTDWTINLPKEIRDQLGDAHNLITQYCNIDFNKNELEAEQLFNLGLKEQKSKGIQSALSYFKRVLEITKNDTLIAHTYNSIGYGQIKAGLILESIENFKKSLKFWPNYGYAYDNLGYSLILIGQLDEGFQYLKRAIETGNNDKGYSLRNHALYYHRKVELKKSKNTYELAFQNIKIPIDFLEYHFADLLFELGENETGMDLLNKSVEKGEQIALTKISEMNNKNNPNTL